MEQALEIRESILVQDHRDIVASYNNIGNILFMQGMCWTEVILKKKNILYIHGLFVVFSLVCR